MERELGVRRGRVKREVDEMKGMLSRKWIKIGMSSFLSMLLLLVICYWILELEIREVFMYLGVILVITLVLFVIEIVIEKRGRR